MAFADGLNSRDPLDDRRERWLVVVFRSRRRPGSQNPGIEWAPKQQREATLLGQRKEIVEAILLQKCVSAGEQETIKGCFLCEANARRDFVDPDTNRPDNPGSSQFLKSTICSIHGFPKSSLIGLRGAMGPDIDIMDERNIYSIHAEALVALLERAHGPIVTVVVDGLEIESPDELTAVELVRRARGGANDRPSSRQQD